MTSMVSGVFAQDNKIYDTVPCTRATLSNWFSTAQIEEHSTVITAGFAGHPSFMNANWAMIKRDVQPAKMISGKKVTNLEHIRFNIVMQSTTITITVDGQERLLLIETEMLDELRARKVDIEDALAFAINHDKNKDEILYGLRTGNMAFGWLDESPSLFLDHVKNKFVGVHKKLFAAGLTNVELGLVLALGFVHEMRHEVSGNIKKTGDYKDPNDEGVQFRKDEVLWKHMTEGMATITSTRDQDLVRFMKYVIGEIAYDEIKRKKIIPSATKAVDYKTVDDLIERINKVRRLRLLEEKARHLVIKIGTIDDLKEILDDVSDMIEIAQQNIKALSTLIENEAKHERHSNLNGILPLIRLVLSEAEPDMYLRGISIADMKAVIEIIHAQVLADLRARSYDVVILENLDDKNGISRETFYNILLNRHSVKPKVQSKSITDKTHVKKVLCDILGESDDTIRAIKESLMFIKRPSPLEKACNNLLLILLRLHEQLYIKGFISPKELSQYTKNVIMILRQNHVLARYAQNFGITELFADNQKVEHEVWDFIEENIDNFKKELDYVIADLLEKTKDKFVWQLISESCAGGTVLLNEGKTVGVFINNKASDKELKHAYIHGLAAAWAWRALASNNIMIEHTDVMVIANLFSRLLSKELISERSYYEEVVQFLDMDDRKGLLLVQYVLEQKKKEYALYRTDDNTIEFIDLYTHQDMLRFIYGSYGQYQSKQFINAQAVHNFYKIYGVVPSPESTLNGTLGRELSHEEIRRLIQSYNEIPNLEIVGQKKIKRTLRKNESTVNGSGFARRNTVDDPMQLQVMYHSA